MILFNCKYIYNVKKHTAILCTTKILTHKNYTQRNQLKHELNEQQGKCADIRALNDRFQEEITKSCREPRECSKCTEFENALTVLMTSENNLQETLRQKSMDHDRSIDALKAKHADIQKVKRSASEDRRRLMTENIELNNTVYNLNILADLVIVYKLYLHITN